MRSTSFLKPFGRNCLFGVSLGGILLAGVVNLRSQTAPPTGEPTIRSSVHEVLLDVVVRQKNLSLARKLKVSDFAVTEDGVPQKIKGFRFVTGGETSLPPESINPPSPSHVSASLDTNAGNARKVQEPSFVSIIFEQVSPGSRKYARDAVQAFLAQELRSNMYVGVFGLDYRMAVLQSFTNNRSLLAKAVDRAALGSYSSLSRDNASILNQADYAAVGSESGLKITSSIDLAKTLGLSTAGADTNITEGAQAAAKIVADQREISMYQGGMRTVVALMKLVQYEASLPGRKTVVYLSEGLNLPPGQHDLIRDVISSANRANVSFYGIDVRGLSTFDANSLARNLSRSAAAVSASQQSKPQVVTERMAKEADEILQMSVANTDLNMEELAQGTGGFAVSDSNEIGKAMERVMQDVRTHYEISYTPTSDLYDGHFRKIQVTVDNPKLTVQSREGYYALPDLNGQIVLPFELKALQALNAQPLPRAFPFWMAAMRFQPAEPGYRYEIAFQLSTALITPRVDTATHTARIHATFLALIKDSRGQIVEKVSRDIDQQEPEDKLDQFQKGQILFTTPVTLPPGHYTVEGVATDVDTGRASTKRAALMVAPAATLALSDVALVHDLQPLTVSRDPGDPLQFTGGKVLPELDGTARASEGASLFFVIYPGAAQAKPKVSVEFFHDGSPVAVVEPALSEPDEVNSIPVITSAKLPAGEYQAQITVRENGHALRRTTAFTVAP